MAFVRLLHDNVTSEPYFQERGNGRQFRRIVGALAWPFTDIPGCLLMVGELRNKPNVLGARRHLHVLAEYRTPDVSELLDGVARLQENWLCGLWVTPTDDPRIALLDDYNDMLRRERRRRIRFVSPPGWEGNGGRLMSLYLGLIQQRIVGEKSLQFGQGCTARDEARRLDRSAMQGKLLEHPGAAALFWAVAEMDLHPLPELGERGKQPSGPACALGGY